MKDKVWFLSVPFLWIGCCISRGHSKETICAQIILWLFIGVILCWWTWSLSQSQQTSTEAKTELALVKTKLQDQIHSLENQLRLDECDPKILEELTYPQLKLHEEKLLHSLNVLRQVKEQEITRLLARTEENLCAICNTGHLEVLFRPCKHVCSCGNCAVRLKDCPICRDRIASREKIFVYS